MTRQIDTSDTPLFTIHTAGLVSSGPSREALFDSLRLGDQKGDPTLFEVECSPRGVLLEGVIKGIDLESGSHNRWMIKVMFRDDEKIGVRLAHHDAVDIFYDTRTRTGTVIDGRSRAERPVIDHTGVIRLNGQRIGDLNSREWFA